MADNFLVIRKSRGIQKTILDSGYLMLDKYELYKMGVSEDE